ncbi:MAG: hypothetical protein K6F14_02635 [Clostridiales bacterium]|nr:hypothetical protein [Clostridiales bacterium]
MNKYQKKIYKTHITHNSYPAFLYWVVFAVLIFAVILLCGNFLKTEQGALDAKKTMGYSYVIESSEFNSKYFSHYKLGQLVPIKNGDNVMHSNFYVQMDSQSVIGIYKKNIGTGEIVISKKIANKLNINIEDSIQVLLPLHDDPTTYTVVDILPYVDDYYDFGDDLDFSVALVGYDALLESHTNGDYIGFFTDADVDAFMTKELPYTKMYYVEAELEQSNFKIVITNIVFFVIIAAAFALYSSLISISLKKEWKKYFVEGIGVTFLRKLVLLDKLIFVSTLGIFISVSALIGYILSIVTLFFALVVLLLCTTIAIINLSWRDKYGKAT